MALLRHRLLDQKREMPALRRAQAWYGEWTCTFEQHGGQCKAVATSQRRGRSANLCRTCLRKVDICERTVTIALVRDVMESSHHNL